MGQLHEHRSGNRSDEDLGSRNRLVGSYEHGTVGPAVVMETSTRDVGVSLVHDLVGQEPPGVEGNDANVG